MKNILLVLLLLPCVFSVKSQSPHWDSTYRPGSYSLKLGEFRSFPNHHNDIIFLGNSITAGIDWSELLQLPEARNRGISGDITFGVLERLDEVTEGHPEKVFILIGINDISRNIPDTLILRNYNLIVSRIKHESPRTKIYFQTMLPVNNEFTQFKNHYNKDGHILYLNNEIRKLGAREHITIIDLYPHFLDASGKLDKRFTQDGLHLNAAGYAVWARLLLHGNYLK